MSLFADLLHDPDESLLIGDRLSHPDELDDNLEPLHKTRHLTRGVRHARVRTAKGINPWDNALKFVKG